MHEEPSWVVSLLVSWLPFLMVVGSVMSVGGQIRKSTMTMDGRSLGDAFSELAHELRRANDLRSPPVG
jgi:hypothetical protein